MPFRRLGALLVVVLVALAACSGGGGGHDSGKVDNSISTRPPASSTPKAATRGLDWHDCGNGQCATLAVPLDPASPHGEQIDLALARVPAKDPDRRIGTLLVNPGGPGAPGADFAPEVARRLPSEITDRFDVVGWDPRGTGHSSPVDCGDRLDYLFSVDTAPDDAAERAALNAASQRFANACEQGSANLLPHIASIDTVHDMERIREALGDDKLTYVGFSYGTYLGALYAQQHPDKVRALVLDGAVDPAIPAAEVSLQQAKGFEASLDAFLQDCARRDDCAFHGGDDPAAALAKLRDRIDREGIRNDDGRELGPSELDIALAAPLYLGASGYDALATALSAAEHGNPDPLFELFDSYVMRGPSGRYSPEWAAFLAISCLDGPELDASTLPALQAEAARQAPVFGASNLGLGVPCAYWPVPPVTRTPTAVSAPTAPPIVVVGTTGDPATPVAWADGLARELGSGRLVTVEGTGHTSSLEGNPCLDRILERYLVDDRPPAAGTRCPA
jgi:pimeloyl-ACP methyl ester carboxylesterase